MLPKEGLQVDCWRRTASEGPREKVRWRRSVEEGLTKKICRRGSDEEDLSEKICRNVSSEWVCQKSGSDTM